MDVNFYTIRDKFGPNSEKSFNNFIFSSRRRGSNIDKRSTQPDFRSEEDEVKESEKDGRSFEYKIVKRRSYLPFGDSSILASVLANLSCGARVCSRHSRR
jgi:hypothetical protein